MTVPADKHFTRYDGPFAIVGTCHHCRHTDVVRKEHNPGRGWGRQ